MDDPHAEFRAAVAKWDEAKRREAAATQAAIDARSARAFAEETVIRILATRYEDCIVIDDEDGRCFKGASDGHLFCWDVNVPATPEGDPIRIM